MVTAITPGSLVNIELNGKPMTIKIRKNADDPEEHDSGITVVSANAPLAKALVNAQEGDSKEFAVGNKINQLRVLSIRS